MAQLRNQPPEPESEVTPEPDVAAMEPAPVENVEVPVDAPPEAAPKPPAKPKLIAGIDPNADEIDPPRDGWVTIVNPDSGARVNVLQEAFDTTWRTRGYTVESSPTPGEPGVVQAGLAELADQDHQNNAVTDGEEA